MKFSLQVSSVIYLDSPSGVGMSYSKNVSDYETGDLKTAADSHTFLLKVYFFIRKILLIFTCIIHQGDTYKDVTSSWCSNVSSQKTEFPPLFLTSGSSSIRSS